MFPSLEGESNIHPQQFNSLRKTCLSTGYSKTPDIDQLSFFCWNHDNEGLGELEEEEKSQNGQHAQACSVGRELVLCLRWVYKWKFC